jgi:hypothetical protein
MSENHEPHIVRGRLALTTYVGTLTAEEQALLQRIGPATARRRSGPAGRPSDPGPTHPQTEAA